MVMRPTWYTDVLAEQICRFLCHIQDIHPLSHTSVLASFLTHPSLLPGAEAHTSVPQSTTLVFSSSSISGSYQTPPFLD